MTDELSVQQQRPSAMPYVLGGAAVGGAGGYFGLPATETTRKWISEPAKYDNWEALIKETSDKDSFAKTVEEAEGETKTMLEKVKDFDEQKVIKEAEENWQKELDKKLADAAGEVADSDEIKELNKQLDELTKAVEKGEKTTETVTRRLSKTEALNKTVAAAETEVKARETVIKLVDDIKAAESEIATRRSQFRTNIKLPNQAEIVSAELEVHQNRLNQLIQNKKNVKNTPAYKALLDQRATAKKGSEAYEKLTQQMNQMENQYNSTIDSLKSKISNIKNFKKNGNAIVQELDTLIDTEARRMAQASTNPSTTTQIRANSEKVLEAKIREIKGLTNEQRKDLLTKAKNELSERTNMLDRTLGAEQKLNSLKLDLSRYSANRQKIVENPRFKKDLVKAKENLAELTQAKELQNKHKKHVKEMWEARKAARKLETTKLTDLTVGDITKGKTYNYVSFKDTLAEADKKIFEKYNKMPNVTKTTEKVVTEGLSKEQLAAKQKEITELTAKIAEKRNALPKASGASVEEITNEFIKNNGTKEEAGKKAVQSFKDDVKGLFEGTKSNKKLWVGVAATAAIGTALALMLRPKNKEQA